MPVAIFARDLDLAGHACERLDPVPGDATGMVARTAGDDVDILDVCEHSGRLRSQGISDDLAALDAPVQRVCEGAGLLEYLLEHEVPVWPLFGRIGAPLRLVHLPIHGLTVRTEDIYFAAGNLGYIALLQVNEALRDRQQSRHTARNKVLADAETYHQRTCNAADHYAVRILRINHQQRKGAGKTGNRFLHGFDKVATLLQMIVNEVRRHFGIGLGNELVALRFELGLDLEVVLYDPVVNNRNAIAGHVRMRVGLGNTAVRGPTRMGYAQQASQRIRPNLVLELGHLADRLAQPDRLVAAENGDTGRIITTIFEAPETLNEYRDDVSFGNCADDSAHGKLLLVS